MRDRWTARMLGAAIAATASLAMPALAAGTVRIEFKDPQSFTDAGWGTVDRETNLRALAEHVHGWQALLPDGQSLEIEVLDLDLAGELRRWRFHPELRVLSGRADWPRMQLRWSLRQGGRVVDGGEERIADVAYLNTVARMPDSGALAYDKRMLDDWLRTRVLAGPGAR